MDKDLQDIEDLFYSALNDNEENPSPKAWGEVDNQLDKESVISIKKKYTSVKRIAILLLLLLGISVYELNKIYDRNNFAENKKPDSINQKKSTQSFDKISKETTGNVSGQPAGSNSWKNMPKGNETLPDSLNYQQELADEVYEKNNEKKYLKEKYLVQSSPSKKRIWKNQLVFDSSKKLSLTSEPFVRSAVKNENPADDNRSFADYNNNKEYQQIPYYKSLQNELAENMILESKDSIDIKNSYQLLITSEANIFNTGNSNVAENKKKNTETLSRFSITPFFSPDIAWYRLQDENVNNQAANAIDIERDEKHEFSSTYGVLADYRLNKQWGLQSGVTLSNINIITEPEIIYAQPDNSGNVKYRVNNSSGYGYILPSFSSKPGIGDSLYAFTSTHSLRYIGIPISVTYSFIKNKFTLGAKMGVSANFLTKAKLETSVEKGPDNSVEIVNNIHGLKKAYFSGLAGISIDFKINKRIALAFAPSMRFALIPINKNALVKSYPMSFGSSVGLKIEL